MVRSAAKNFEDVAIVTSRRRLRPPRPTSSQLNLGMLSRATRWRLAKQAFATTAAYDTAIANALEQHGALHSRQPLPPRQPNSLKPSASPIPSPRPCATAKTLTSAPPSTPMASGGGIATARQLQGKELSYNNLVDLDACWELVEEFEEPAVAIIKHTNPCGAATGHNRSKPTARRSSPTPSPPSAASSASTAKSTAMPPKKSPSSSSKPSPLPPSPPMPCNRFATKKNLRLLDRPSRQQRPRPPQQISGGLLLQDADNAPITDDRSQDRHRSRPPH